MTKKCQKVLTKYPISVIISIAVKGNIINKGIYMKNKLDLKLYLALFNAVTTAIEELEKSEITTPQTVKTLEILKNAQLTTEEMYINSEADDD